MDYKNSWVWADLGGLNCGETIRDLFEFWLGILSNELTIFLHGTHGKKIFKSVKVFFIYGSVVTTDTRVK